MVKNTRIRDGWQRQFRSSMASVGRFFEDVTLKNVHIECLKRTPFYHFPKPFIRGKMTSGSLHGMQEGTLQFLMTFNKTEKSFKLGNKRLTIEPQEFDLIFGIKSGEQEIDMTKSLPLARHSCNGSFPTCPK